MTLSDFIEKRGRQECAELFGVSIRTIDYWKSGDIKPPPDKLSVIVKTTGLTPNEIYGINGR
jgi:hypothetical protein